MNSKLVIAALLALAFVSFGAAAIADSDDSAATIDDGNNYEEQTYGDNAPKGFVNFSDFCLVLGVILIIGAAIIGYMAIYTKLYGDF